MKNAILYIRVSTDEQANKGFSLRDQEQKLLNYCKVNNINVLIIFKDDHSAKTFNRPEFKKLVQYVKTNKSKIDQLIFTKWDRFSRNTTESYNKIKDFNELGIIVNAIEQPLDLSIPEQGLMRAVYLSMPEVENHRRSLNVIAGMRRAFKEGRYIVSPPKGYSMGRDDSNKPILKANADAKHLKEAFELLATRLYNQKEVLTKLRENGFRTSKSAFSRMIRNPIYAGKIHLKAFKDEPAIVVNGIHEALISKSIFDKVQIIIDGRKQQKGAVHKKVNEKFPLKGFVLCPHCHKPLRASSSKGRNQYYSYYHCAKPCGTRYKLEDVEAWFKSFLGSISLNKPVENILYKMIEEQIHKQSEHKGLGPTHYMEKEKLNNKLIKIQDLFIEGDLNKEEYGNAKRRFQKNIGELNDKEINLKKNQEILKVYKQGLKKLYNFDTLFENSDLERKRQLVGSMFPEMFQFEKNKVRTEDINPLILKIASVNKGLCKNKKRDKSKNIDLSHEVLKAGLEPVLLKRLDFESSSITNFLFVFYNQFLISKKLFNNFKK